MPNFPPSAFRDQVQKDFNDMLNQTVFGLTISWNGTPTICALGQSSPYDPSPKQSDPNISNKEPGGDLLRKVTYIFRRTEMQNPPVVSSEVRVDGKKWIVQSVSEQISHIVVNLVRAEG